MKVQCSFDVSSWSYYSDQFYCCKVKDQQILEDSRLEFIGNHEDCKTNKDVTYVEFTKCYMSTLPQGLSSYFPNLKIIAIGKSKLKTVTKNDLIGLRRLKIFFCWGNDIEFVPGDLFDGSREMEWVSFPNNKLKIVEPNLLDNLQNIKYVHLGSNPNYDIFYAIFPQNKKNTTLEDVKNYLIEKFFVINPIIVKDFILKFPHPVEELEKYMTKVKTTETILKMKKLKSEMFDSPKEDEIQELRRSVQHLSEESGHLRIFLQSLSNENQNLKTNFQTQIDNLTKQIQKGLFSDLRKFIQDENIKDFKITVGDREFPVHKFLLTIRSPTLAEILRNNPEVENLNLVDISVEIFEKILNFLYTDELSCEDGTNFLHLFAAAGKLKIDELMDFAVQKILNQIDSLNVLEVFYLANKYGHEELIQKSFNEVKKKYPNAKFRKEWARDPDLVTIAIETDLVMKNKEM